MSDISAGFFHNLAISHDRQRVYMWGCNPQVQFRSFLIFFSCY
jgi:alpha-tubulin suppressor-like RCC1 family protein